MAILNTQAQFILDSIKQVIKDLEDNNYPSKINTINVYDMGCEWCSNESLSISIGLSQTGEDHFTKGHCNRGVYTIFQDESFGRQSEWFVCNHKECSGGE